jgi:hypothetical protein
MGPFNGTHSPAVAPHHGEQPSNIFPRFSPNPWGTIMAHCWHSARAGRARNADEIGASGAVALTLGKGDVDSSILSGSTI